jgi:hypothetical protein
LKWEILKDCEEARGREQFVWQIARRRRNCQS